KTFGVVSSGGRRHTSLHGDGSSDVCSGDRSVGCSVTAAGSVSITAAAVGSDFCVIEASQAAAGNYTSAGPVSQSFHIAKATPNRSEERRVGKESTSGDGAFGVRKYGSANSV